MNQQAVVLNNLYKSLQLPKAMYLPFRIEDEEAGKSLDIEKINFLLSTKNNSLSKSDEIKIINSLLAADRSKIETRNLMRSFDKVLYDKSSFLCWIHARAYLREHKYVEAKKLLVKSVNKNNSAYQYYDEISSLLFLMLQYTHSVFYRKFSLIGNHVYSFSLWDADVNILKILFQFDSHNKIYCYGNYFYLVNNLNILKVINGEVYEFKKNIVNNFLYRQIINILKFSDYLIQIFFLAKSNILKYSDYLIQIFFLAKSNILKYSRTTLRNIGVKSFKNLKFCNYFLNKVNYAYRILHNFLAKFKNNQARNGYKKNTRLCSLLLKLIKNKVSRKYTYDEVVQYCNKLDKES